MSRHHSTVAVTDKILGSCRPTKRFDYHRQCSITSLDYDDSGQYLISSGIDKSIQLYDMHKGTHTKDIQSQKYGAHLARFTHHDLECLYASTPAGNVDVDHAIRCLNLNSNQYIRYFKGHKDQVTAIEVNPLKNVFVSSSLDRTVKLWDLQTSSPIGNLDVGAESSVAFDPQGMVFGVATVHGHISLYDIASFDKSPFLSVVLPRDNVTVAKLEFANNGKTLLVGTTADHYIVDAFSGQILTTIRAPPQTSYKYPTTSSCTFSSCGKFVLVGSEGKVVIYDLNGIKTTDGAARTVYDDTNPMFLDISRTLVSPDLPKVIAFNPKLFTFATADNTVSIWQPM